MPCEYCCERDENDKYIEEPCCNKGPCNAENLLGSKMGMCKCCGAEMFYENGNWYHHSQREIPIKDRGMVHWGPQLK